MAALAFTYLLHKLYKVSISDHDDNTLQVFSRKDTNGCEYDMVSVYHCQDHVVNNYLTNGGHFISNTCIT